MDRKINIIKIPNPFNRREREISIAPFRGETLAQIRENFGPKNIDVIVSLNGKIIPVNDQPYIALRDNDYITMLPVIAGKGMNPFAVLGMIAVIIGASIVGQYWVGPTIASAYGAAAGTAAAMTFTAGVALVGGMVINALLPPPKYNAPGMDTSQAYSWNPQTTQRQGGVIPRAYGLNKVYGNIVSRYVENANDQQYLNVLIDLGLGPVNRLYDFKINDQPVDNFKGVEIHTRLGYLDQDVIPNFNDTKVEYTFSTKVVYGSAVEVMSYRNDFDGLEVDLTFPKGLWYSNDRGGLDTNSVTLRVLAKLDGTEDWIVLSETGTDRVENGYDGKWSAGYWVAGDENWMPYFWYEYTTGSTNPFEHYDGEIYDPEYSYNIMWRWIQSSNEIVATRIIDTCVISDYRTRAIYRTFRKGGLTHGSYTIKVEKLTAERSSTRYGDEVYLTAIREIFNDDFEYPRRVLVGIRALGTDQISGSLRFSCLMEGALVRVYDGSDWTVEYSNNPAWVRFDALSQPVFDNDLNVVRYDGIDPSRLDLEKFLELDEYCDDLVPDGNGGTEPRMTFNGIFDTESSLWESVLKISQVDRATLVFTGTDLTLAIDKPSDPVALFTVGNIGIDSFNAPFFSLEDRASEIEVDFKNKDMDFERDIFSVFDPDINEAAEKVTMNLFGITKPSEAWRNAKYRLNNNKILKRAGSMSLDADALACTIGDVVNVAHDVPQWGYSGRLVSISSMGPYLKLGLDRSVVVESGKYYQIQFREDDDTLKTKTVYNLPNDAEIITNGEFEIDGTGIYPHMFADWGDSCAGTSTVNKDTDIFHGGLVSCRMDVDSNGHVASTGRALILQPGGKYRLRFYYRCTGTAISARGNIQAIDSLPHKYLQMDGTWSGTYGAFNLPHTNGEWVEYALDFTACEQTNYKLWIAAGGANDANKSIWFDDVSITSAEDTSEILISETEIVLNPGFEIAGAGGDDTLLGWVETLNGHGTIMRDSSKKYFGNYSAKFTSTSGQIWAYQEITLNAGSSYIISFYYIAASPAQARADLRTSPDDYWLQSDGSWNHWGLIPPEPAWLLPTASVWTFMEIPFVAPVSGTYTVFLVSSEPGTDVYFDQVSIRRIPQKHNPYSFGESEIMVKPFRITNMTRSQDMQFELSLAEYNASIYASDLDEPVLPTPNYSALSSIGSVEGLTCSERLIKAEGGGTRAIIDVSFAKPKSFLFSHAEIWYAVNEGSYVYTGRCVDGRFRIDVQTEQCEYRIKAVSVNTLNVKQSFPEAPEVSLFVFGKMAPPADIESIWSEPCQGGVRLSWSPISDIDLDYYLVRYHPDPSVATWATSLDVAKIYSTSLSLPAAKNGMYFIKAVDLSGNESETAAGVITTIPSVLGWNNQYYLEQEPDWDGDKTNMTITGDDLYLDVGAEIPAIGYYEPDPIDLGSVQSVRCYGELIYYGVDDESGFDDIMDIDALDNFNGAEILGVGVEMQISLSQDNVNWDDWQTFLVGDFTARAFKFRTRAWSNFSSRYVYIDTLHFGIDLPERSEKGDGVSIASGGTAITYETPFINRPQVGIAIESASQGDTIKLTNQSETGFTLQILNGGSGVSRTVDWRAVGF